MCWDEAQYIVNVTGLKPGLILVITGDAGLQKNPQV